MLSRISPVDDPLFYYTYAAILFKSILFLGLMIDATHCHILFFSAANFVLEKPAYRLIFYCASPVLLLNFALLLKNRARLWYLLSLNLIISVILISDLWYLRGFDTVPTLHLLRQGSNLSHMRESVFGMSRVTDIVFMWDAGLLMLYAFFKRSLYSSVTRRKALCAAYTGIVLFLLAGFVPVRYHLRDRAIREMIIFPYNQNVTFCNLSPVGYHLYSIYDYWKDCTAYSLSKEDTLKISTWYGKKSEELPGNRYKGLFKGKNLLIVQMESMEKFVIRREVNGQEITPNLNRLTKHSLYFTNVHEQVCNGNTADAELMANTSVFPLRRGGTFFRYPYTSYLSLPLMMKRDGYSTLAAHSDEGAFWNWKTGLTSIGFDRCLDSGYFTKTESFGMGLSDSAYVEQMIPVITAQPQPFYIFMVTLSNHTPFNLPRQLRRLRIDGPVTGTRIEDYFQSAHYADQCIGQLMNRLRQKEILKNTVVVFYGDHEGIHKYFPDQFFRLPEGDRKRFENRKETPLIVYAEGLKEEEISTIGGEIDIMPTIAYLMGLDDGDTAASAMGRNLLNTRRNCTVLADGTFLGKGTDEEKKNELEGLEVADLVIRGNYFKTQSGDSGTGNIAHHKTRKDGTLQ